METPIRRRAGHWGASALVLAVLGALAGARPAAAQVSYPPCSRCTAASGSEERCWSETSFVLSSCGEEGLCANKACAGPGESHVAAITRYIQNKRLTGCASTYTTVEGFPAKSCAAALVVYNPARRCAYGVSRSTAHRVSEIGALWTRTSVVGGGTYDVGFELGAPASEARVLKNLDGGDAASYQMFDRGGITITPSWNPGFPAAAQAAWVGGRTERAMMALGARWKQSPFILAGTQLPSVESGYAAHGYHDRKRPTTLYSSGGPAGKVGGPSDVAAAIWTRWHALGGFEGPDSLSYPMSEETNGAQRFARGILAADGSATPTAHLLGEAGTSEADALFALWQAPEASVPRTAASDVVFFPENGGGYQVDNDMSGAARASFIVRPGAQSAITVAGDTASYWRDSQGAAGFLKWPTSNATAIAGGGSVQSFEGGNLYQKPGGPAFAVAGGASPILAAYVAAGGPTGVLGFPIEDAHSGGGSEPAALKQRFEHGRITVTDTIAIPEVYDGVKPPGDFRITAVTHDTVSLRWFDHGSPYTVLFRKVNEGPYVRIATMTLPRGDATFTDTAATVPSGPVSGADNRYQAVAADNPDGYCSAGYHCEKSAQPSVYVPVAGEVPVSRVQLRIKVGTVEGAGTDNTGTDDSDTDKAVGVRLGSFTSWLDTPIKDFLPGSDVVYDLQTDGIAIASDIREIRIAVDGNDGLCVDEIELFLNCGTLDVDLCVPPGHRVFKKLFGPTTCAWAVDSHKGGPVIRVDLDELRAPNAFGTWPEPFEDRQGALTLDSVASLADAAMGHAFHGQGHRPRFHDGVLTQRAVVNEQTLHITQAVDVDSPIGTIHATVNYDLVLVDTPEGTSMEVQNEDVDAPPFADPLTAIIQTYVVGRLEDALEQAPGSGLGTPPSGQYFCFSGNFLTLCP